MIHDGNALNAEEVAQILQVSKNTVYNLVKGGTLTSYNVGRKLRFTMDDVQTYISSAHHGGKSASPEGKRRVASVPSQTPGLKREKVSNAFRIAGNDLVADVLANYLGGSGMLIQRVYENSYHALIDLYEGRAEAALVNLYDHKTDSYNIPYIQRMVPGKPLTVVRIVTRRQGLLVRQHNPKNIHDWSDFLRDDITMVNRECGSGSRVLLDEKLLLMEESFNHPKGYQRECPSELSLAVFVARGGADVGIGGERVFHQISGLDFLPRQEEQLDLVLTREPRTQRIIEFLKSLTCSRGFKEEIGSLTGYDNAFIGKVLYEV